MISNRNASTDATLLAARASGLALVMALLLPVAFASSAQAQPFAYVVGQPNVEGGTAVVSVIDTATNGRVASIPIGPNCRLCVTTDGIAIAPDVGRVYASNDFGQSLSVIDIASNSVVATPAIGGGPTAVVASPNGARLYVLNGSGASVLDIDTATNAILNSTPLGVTQARGMAITPDGSRLYVSTFGSNSLKVVSTATMTVTATIPVGQVPLGVDVSPDGSHVYVAAYSSNAVNVINTTTHAVATIPVGTGPLSARVSPDGTRVYVANDVSSTVTVINTQTNTVVNTVPVQSSPRTLDFTPDGTRAYVANSTNVQVIDTASHTVLTTIPFDTATHGYPASIVIGRDTGGNPPTAVNESYLTAVNTSLGVPVPGVLGNDQTNGGGPMTAVLVGNVAQGTLALNANGSFAYTPAPGFSGTDSFTYRAVNSAGSSNLATVVLSVVTGPQPPTGLYVSSVVGNTVTLRWTPPAVGDTPTGYVLAGGVSPGEVLATFSTGSTAPTFTFVAPSGSFYIRMHTVSGANTSAASEEIRLVVGAFALPSTPANLLGVVSGSTVSLAWRNTFEGGAPTDLFLHVTGSLGATLLLPVVDSVTVAGVPNGTYTLNLRAANATGASALSNSVTLTVPSACSGVPAAPSNFLASKDGNLITVLWERATTGAAATGFVVNVTGSFVGSFPTTQRTLSGTVGPGVYTITVQATNVCGASLPTLPQTVVIP
jgi:YVTN family beta-propeller protein